jgi:hypothetical protein
MDERNKLALVHVLLEFGSHLLQPSDGQSIRHSNVVDVTLLVDRAMGGPGARRPLSVGLAVGGKATRRSHETERGEGGQPIKPLSRTRRQAQLTFLRYSCLHRFQKLSIRSEEACGIERVVRLD